MLHGSIIFLFVRKYSLPYLNAFDDKCFQETELIVWNGRILDLLHLLSFDLNFKICLETYFKKNVIS